MSAAAASGIIAIVSDRRKHQGLSQASRGTVTPTRPTAGWLAAGGITTVSYSRAFTLLPTMLLHTQKAHETPNDMPDDCIYSKGAALLTKRWLKLNKTEDPFEGARALGECRGDHGVAIHQHDMQGRGVLQVPRQ